MIVINFFAVYKSTVETEFLPPAGVWHKLLLEDERSFLPNGTIMAFPVFLFFHWAYQKTKEMAFSVADGGHSLNTS